MHTFLLVCFITNAVAQYNYGAGVNNDEVFIASNTNDLTLSAQPLEEEYNKSFYSYSAPEQEFDDLNVNEQISNALKKNIRVIFIKGPENTALENAFLQLAKATTEDRTAIYVLNKQSDIGSLATQLQQHKANSDVKPEVHFVKYRTQADAENAQRAIQAQYDSLPGTSSSNGPSSASVLNFVSNSASPSAINNIAVSAPSVTTTSAPARGHFSPRNSYLPPRKRY